MISLKKKNLFQLHNHMQGRHTFISDFISRNHCLFCVDFILFTTPFVFANYWYTLLEKEMYTGF